MTIAMGLLALFCVVLGVGAAFVAPIIANIAMSLSETSALTVTQGAILVPDSASQAMFSPALTFILLIALPLIPFLIYLGLKGGQPAFRRKGNPWACGYVWEKTWRCLLGLYSSTT